MPSEKESFGLAALEAMACEVPVVSSDAGGIPELNIHGKTGFISRIGDIQDMVQNALFILKDENLPIFKHNAIERAKEFDITAILPRYEAFYEKVLALSRSKDLIGQANNNL
jgi:glycosyltransferase involved in cell wall biosynthesis